MIALIWHPDKVEASKREEAEEVFKNIKEAYDVLSDGTYPSLGGVDVLAEKRKLYDQYGMLLNCALR
jgi:DnaJ-class molecular chaperone